MSFNKLTDDVTYEEILFELQNPRYEYAEGTEGRLAIEKAMTHLYVHFCLPMPEDIEDIFKTHF